MATLSIEKQELKKLRDPTASTFDTSESGIIKPVFSTNENTQLEILKELETNTFNSVDKDDTQIIIGTPNADTLNGADGNDIITSLDVGDIVSGRNGDDLISGGGGNDYLLGDAVKISSLNDAKEGKKILENLRSQIVTQRVQRCLRRASPTH